MLINCWHSVADDGLTLNQRWFNVLPLLGCTGQGKGTTVPTSSLHKALRQCCVNAGPVGQTEAQHETSVGLTSGSILLLLLYFKILLTHGLPVMQRRKHYRNQSKHLT